MQGASAAANPYEEPTAGHPWNPYIRVISTNRQWAWRRTLSGDDGHRTQGAEDEIGRLVGQQLYEMVNRAKRGQVGGRGPIHRQVGEHAHRRTDRRLIHRLIQNAGHALNPTRLSERDTPRVNLAERANQAEAGANHRRVLAARYIGQDRGEAAAVEKGQATILRIFVNVRGERLGGQVVDINLWTLKEQDQGGRIFHQHRQREVGPVGTVAATSGGLVVMVVVLGGLSAVPVPVSVSRPFGGTTHVSSVVAAVVSHSHTNDTAGAGGYFYLRFGVFVFFFQFFLIFFFFFFLQWMLV